MIGRGDRRGVTLVELTIAVVLGTALLASIHQILVTNQRTYTLQSAQVRDRQTLRAGLALLSSELREISPADGDLVEMETASVAIRAPRSLGLVCEIVSGGVHPIVRTRKLGRYLPGDSARVFYENHPSRIGDDAWRTAVVEVRDSTGSLACPGGSTAQEIRLRGVRWGARPDSFTIGAPIRTLSHHRYFLGEDQNRTWLMQEDPDGNPRPVAGPIDPRRGLQLRYLDAGGNPTATPADVREIEVTLRTPARRGGAGTDVQDSLTMRLHPRNTG